MMAAHLAKFVPD